MARELIFWVVSLFLIEYNCEDIFEPGPTSTCEKKDERIADLEEKLLRLQTIKDYNGNNKDDSAKDYTISHHVLPNTLTWSSSYNFCKGFGASLCTAEEICPVDRKGPIYGVVSGDSWTPDGGLYNNWVQTGNNPHLPCTQTTNPPWGQKSSAYNFKGRLFCCKAESHQKRFDWTEHTLGDHITWANAKRFCSNKPHYSLCRADQVCNKGVPLSGILRGDHWTPIADKSNDWIQTGDIHSPCLRHETYGPPAWGTTINRQDFKGRVFCCKEEPSKCTTSDSDDQICPKIAKAGMCSNDIGQRHCCKSCDVCQDDDKGSLCYLVDQKMCMDQLIRSVCCKACRKLIG